MQPSSSESKHQESAAERWERWRATQPAARRRALTRTEQRRMAQKASVKTRRHNAALRERQAHQDAALQESEVREQLRKGVALLSAHPPFATPVVKEKMLWQPFWLQNRWPLLFVNDTALHVVQTLFGGRSPQWVRPLPWGLPRYHSRLTFDRPPKSWWLLEDDLVLAMWLRTAEEEEEHRGAPFIHVIKVYYLKPHDLLSHHDRHNMPYEAVAWDPILGGDLLRPRLQARPNDPLPRDQLLHPGVKLSVVHVNGQVPPPRRLIRRIVEAWITDGKGRRLPWA